MSLPDLATDPEAVRARKKPVPVQVAFAPAAGEIPTLEGTVRHAAGDAIVTGVRGERWPVARERFDATYETIPPTRIGEDGAYRKRPLVVWARRLRAPFIVPAGREADRITGVRGDWLVQYSRDEFGIVAAGIFAETYELI